MMKKKVDLLIVTHLPVFYKVNLYNELAKSKNIHVIYIANQTEMRRSDDFLTLHKCKHSYNVVNATSIEKRNVFSSLFNLFNLYRKYDFSEILVSGWELPEFQFLIHVTVNEKNSLALESTANEGFHRGWKAFLKRNFLKRIAKVYASGSKHLELLEQYNFVGKRVVTKGVGLINYSNFSSERLVRHMPSEVKLLYIGRLSEEKNISGMINAVKGRSDVFLTICGTGPLVEFVNKYVDERIIYKGAVNNSDLIKELSDSHCLILPSFMEPWGLVVEEALYSNLPVIVSSNAGISELVEDGVNGYLFDPNEEQGLTMAINKFIDNFDLVDFTSQRIGSRLILSKDQDQVQSYAKH